MDPECEDGETPWYDEDRQAYTYRFIYRTHNGETSTGDEVLPDALRNELHISDAMQKLLTEMNDDGSHSFSDIADELEQNVICEDDDVDKWRWNTAARNAS